MPLRVGVFGSKSSETQESLDGAAIPDHGAPFQKSYAEKATHRVAFRGKALPLVGQLRP